MTCIYRLYCNKLTFTAVFRGSNAKSRVHVSYLEVKKQIANYA